MNYIFDFDDTLTVISLAQIQTQPIFNTNYLLHIKESINYYNIEERDHIHYSFIGMNDDEEDTPDFTAKSHIYICEKSNATELYNDVENLMSR